MPDDFKPSKPAFRGSVSRGGEIDWKDRSTQLSMWVGKDKRGQYFLNGKVGGDKEKSVVLFLVDDQDGDYEVVVKERKGGNDGGDW